MRKLTLIPCLAAAIALGACGGKRAPSGDANAAEVTAETASVATPNGPTGPVVTSPVSFDDAKTAFTDKRYAESVRLFTAYTAEHPDNVWGYYMLGLSAWKAGDRDAAVSALRSAIEKDSTHVKSRLNLTRVLIEQGKADEALPQVEAVLQLDSASNEAYRLLGRVKAATGDSAGAIDAFKHAIVLDGSDAWAMNDMARVYIEQGKFDDALGPLARAIEIDSTVTTFRGNLGFALAHSSRVDLADLSRGFVERVKTWQ